MNLTKAQKMIVEHLAGGCTCDETAVAINRSVHTVRTHVKQACERVEAKNIPHLVAISLSRGFIKALCLTLALSICTGSDDAMRRGSRLHRMTKREVEVQVYA